VRAHLTSHLLLAGLALAMPAPASAEMVLSQVIVDLEPGEAPRDDIEVLNSGSERMYVLVEPFEVIGAGTPEERRVRIDDPSQGGLLVSPQRIVLAPGERRAIRVALTEGRPARERVYRVAIKPVAGQLVSDVNAVKVMVGYDVLVLARPEQALGGLSGERIGQRLVIRNEGNASQEIFEGRQCDQDGGDCRALPAKRLYSGASWEQTLPFDTPATYAAAQGSKVVKLSF
jgi:P pilus assembly chaperone PapD